MLAHPDFATMAARDVIGYLRGVLAANPAARSVTLTRDRATGEYRFTVS